MNRKLVTTDLLNTIKLSTIKLFDNIDKTPIFIRYIEFVEVTKAVSLF